MKVCLPQGLLGPGSTELYKDFAHADANEAGSIPTLQQAGDCRSNFLAPPSSTRDSPSPYPLEV